MNTRKDIVMTEQIVFHVRWDGECWLARSDPHWSAVGYTRGVVERKCHEYASRMGKRAIIADDRDDLRHPGPHRPGAGADRLVLALIDLLDARMATSIRKLHRPCTEVPVKDGGCRPGDCSTAMCVECSQDWPCGTIRVLEDDGETE